MGLVEVFFAAKGEFFGDECDGYGVLGDFEEVVVEVGLSFVGFYHVGGGRSTGDYVNAVLLGDKGLMDVAVEDQADVLACQPR